MEVEVDGQEVVENEFDEQRGVGKEGDGEENYVKKENLGSGWGRKQKWKKI